MKKYPRKHFWTVKANNKEKLLEPLLGKQKIFTFGSKDNIG